MPEFAWDPRGQSTEPTQKPGAAAPSPTVEARQRKPAAGTAKKSIFSKSIAIPSGVSPKDLVAFTRQFATMIDAGLPLVQCLRILSEQQQNQVFANALRDIRTTVEQGASFSDALKRHPKIFDHMYVSLVQTGEVGGVLDTVLNRLAGYIEKRLKLVRQVKSALVYPSAVTVILFVVVWVLLTFVIPAFEGLFADFGSKQQLPLLTRGVIWLSHTFVSALPATIPLTLLAIGAAVWLYRQPKGKAFAHRWVLVLPVIGSVMTRTAIARFARTLSTLLHSGVPILDALEVCAKSSGNVVIADSIMYTRARIAEGQVLAVPLTETGVFPHMVVQMISVGEQTGSLDAMLDKLADFYDEEVDVAVATMTSMMEPVLMVVVGLVVGVVLLAMYMPIFSMAGALTQ